MGSLFLFPFTEMNADVTRCRRVIRKHSLSIGLSVAVDCLLGQHAYRSLFSFGILPHY